MPRKHCQRCVPLRNEEREIVKLGIYGCCDRKWKGELVKEFRNGKFCFVPLKKVCRNCGRNIGPHKIIDLEERWFGHFKCTAKKYSDKKSRELCGRSWKSSWTWTVNNQIQTTQCKTCEADTMPYQIVSFQSSRTAGTSCGALVLTQNF